MQNVLFKISRPAFADGELEFYIVSLSLQGLNGKIGVVQESHGWWNNGTRKPTLDQEFLSPPESFASFSEAIDRFCALRVHRARAGFVHSFSWDGFVGDPSNYKLIDPSAEPRFRSSTQSGE